MSEKINGLGATTQQRMDLRNQFGTNYYGNNGIQNYGGVTADGYVSPEALKSMGMSTNNQVYIFCGSCEC